MGERRVSTVAVIIPCFNHGHFLAEAVQSVRNQTFPAAELLVVDDGSDEQRTIRCLAEIEGEGVRVIRRKNGGPGAARNSGIAASSSDFVVCLDADDRLRPSFLERTVPLLDADPKVGIAYGRAAFFGAEKGEAMHPPYRFPDFLLDPCIYATALFRRADWEATGGYSEEMREGWEDFEFWVSLVERGCQVKFVDEVLFEYRRHAGSRDRAFSESRERVLTAFERIFQRHRELYTRHIRLLFEAHLERLDLRMLFPTGGRAELRLSRDGRETLVRSREPVGGSGTVLARFPIPDNAESGETFRLDPFVGPGAFRLEAIAWRQAGVGDAIPFSRESVGLEAHSFGVRIPGRGGDEVFFPGPDPQLWFRWDNPPTMEMGGELEIRYAVRRGPPVAGEFFSHLGGVQRRFDRVREEADGLRLELEHVKGELVVEMERRRRVQGTLGYRLGRFFGKLFGR